VGLRNLLAARQGPDSRSVVQKDNGDGDSQKDRPDKQCFLTHIYELKTEPQEKFLFLDNLVSDFETANAEHEPREAAAADSRTDTDRNGCLPLAQCSGSAPCGFQADLSIKDYHRNKSLKILLFRPPFACRGFVVRMNGAPWPKSGGPVCLTRLLAALRKALVRAAHP
jgi:hypothetical protein